MSEKKITDEEIQKALSVLDEIGNYSEENELSKGESDDLAKSETDKAPENLEKLNNGELVDLIKSMQEDLNSKVQSLGHVNRFLVQENESLKTDNQTIIKSLEANAEILEKVLVLSEEMANSPLSRLGSTIKKSVQVEKFGSGETDSGKKSISLTKNKREVLGLLYKSLETEEGQKRLGQVVGLVENGYVDQNNFDFLRKSVQNEIGGDYNITF